MSVGLAQFRFNMNLNCALSKLLSARQFKNLRRKIILLGSIFATLQRLAR